MLFMEDSQPTDDVDSSSIGKKLNVISKFDIFIYLDNLTLCSQIQNQQKSQYNNFCLFWIWEQSARLVASCPTLK